MKLNGIVIKMLSEKSKIEVTSKIGAVFLRNDIEAKTGEALSINTIKRLTGILHYDSSPREATLDIIANYLGYNNWNQLISSIQNKISDFNIPSDFIDLQELPEKKEVIVKWQPGRNVHLIHQNSGKFIVIKSENSKLIEGDVLYLSQIAIGFPFMAKEVIRDGNSLGNYTAAQVEGLSSIEIING